jgi:hypothetical protein
MWMKRSSLVFTTLLASGCTHSSDMRSPLVENDRSIVFPQFFELPAVTIGEGGSPYELDGVILRAIMIASSDFLPPVTEETPCWDKPEAYQYRVIRQGSVVFVHIMEDLEHCGLQYIAVDSGAKYAVSTDGRILRRLIGAEPDHSISPEAFGAPQTIPSSPPLPEEHDGGSGIVLPPPPSPAPLGQDGGTSGSP